MAIALWNGIVGLAITGDMCALDPITPAAVFSLPLAAADRLAGAEKQSIQQVIAARQAFAGLFDAALETARIIETASKRSTTLFWIAVALAEAGRFADALAIGPNRLETGRLAEISPQIACLSGNSCRSRVRS